MVYGGASSMKCVREDGRRVKSSAAVFLRPVIRYIFALFQLTRTAAWDCHCQWLSQYSRTFGLFVQSLAISQSSAARSACCTCRCWPFTRALACAKSGSFKLAHAGSRQKLASVCMTSLMVLSTLLRWNQSLLSSSRSANFDPDNHRRCLISTLPSSIAASDPVFALIVTLSQF